MRAGANDVRMEDLSKGRFCGMCHDNQTAWGLENACLQPELYSSALTAVMVPDGTSADALRRIILDRFDLSLGGGLGKLADKVFRIGHWVTSTTSC